MADAITDISRALAELRQAYQKHGIPVPDQISYSDPRQEYEARRWIRGVFSTWALQHAPSAHAEANGDVISDVTIQGFRLIGS